MELLLDYLFFLGPNLLWTGCIFYILKKDKIKPVKKILYLLICNILFMFADTTLGKDLLNDTVVDVTSFIVEFLQIVLCAYWAKKNNIVNIFEKDED